MILEKVKGMDDGRYHVRMIFLSWVELSFHLFLPFTQRRTEFQKTHQQKLGWSWLGGEIFPRVKLLFPPFGPTSSEHDPPWSSRETVCSSSGQESSPLSLPGENRRASAPVELGKVQDSHAGKVDFWMLELRKNLFMWYSQWHNWSGVSSLWIQMESNIMTVRLLPTKRGPV